MAILVIPVKPLGPLSYVEEHVRTTGQEENQDQSAYCRFSISGKMNPDRTSKQKLDTLRNRHHVTSSHITHTKHYLHKIDHY